MLLDTIKTLCALSGPSSFEGPVRDYLRRRAEAAGAQCRVDSMGNLICFKRGAVSAPNRLLLAAHMDEVGLIVRRITDDGYLKFSCLGGIDRRVLIGKPVFLGENRVPGIIGLKAIHLTTAAERKTVPELKELYIDIGASSREDAEKLTHVGDFAVFSDRVDEFGQGLLKAKAIDDRVGCAILLELLERELPIDVTFAFTVQEEVGCRGAFGAAFSVAPQVALVIETTTAADLAGMEGHKQVCAPGKGPVISFMDGGSVADRKLFELMRDLAVKHDIPWQTKHYLAGGNDASVIQRSREGVRTVVMSAAVRYLHAPASVAAIRDFDHMFTLARLFLQAMAQEEEKKHA